MNRRFTVLGLVIACAAAARTPVGAQSCCLTGDANTDLQVDLLDVPPFVETVLDPASADQRVFCACDTNHDDVVDGDDIADFVVVMLDPHLALFDFGPAWPDAEAEQIGLEMQGPGGKLLLSADEYARVDRDLDLIRAAYPALAAQTHSPAWSANELIVKILAGLPAADYECLNAYYQVTTVEHLFGDWYVLTFAGNLNVEALALAYEALPEIQYADPNGLIGGENFWRPTVLGGDFWEWDIDDGFWDCFDGCDCHRHYVIQTDDAGQVDLIWYEEYGWSWCEF